MTIWNLGCIKNTICQFMLLLNKPNNDNCNQINKKGEGSCSTFPTTSPLLCIPSTPKSPTPQPLLCFPHSRNPNPFPPGAARERERQATVKVNSATAIDATATGGGDTGVCDGEEDGET